MFKLPKEELEGAVQRSEGAVFNQGGA